MAMTNAERQRIFRERRKAKGLKRQDEWIMSGGGYARSERYGSWPMMTKQQLDGAIEKAVAVFDGDDAFLKKVVYAEIAAYAEKAAARFEQHNRRALGKTRPPKAPCPLPVTKRQGYKS
jgi:hypothetical protein